MYAITVARPGPPDVLEWTEVADPIPAHGEVLIDVAAAGVNRADVLQRQGRYSPPAGAPSYPGLECAGRIAAIGEGVTGWRVGEEVAALLSGGGYAERVCVPVGQVLPAPKRYSLIDAAALPEVVATVWSNIFMTGRLAPGERLLIHGGAGGVGTMAIQLAKRHGAWVACTAGSQDKLAVCRELGADLAINYQAEDFVSRLREETQGHGADVVLDNMGGRYLSRNVEALGVEGRLIVIGLQGGRSGELDLGALLTKQALISATTLRGRTLGQKAHIIATVQASAWPLIDAGEVKPVVRAAIPMPQAAQAHRLMESGQHIGKIVLTAPRFTSSD